MLAIRLQRTGRKGHAQFRMIVQESRRTPTSGNVVALLGQYNPHTKTVTIDAAKAEFYLVHGAQPSDRVARLLKKEGIKLPKWVQLTPNKERTIRHPEKLRSNRPAEKAPAQAEAVEASTAEPEVVDEADSSTTVDEVESDNSSTTTEETEKTVA